MNYLAHAFLSLKDEEIMTGNMMGDFVKGNHHQVYPKKIQQGILLHRSIDDFTDHHALILEAKHYFKPAYRFSGSVFTDIIFDHFLANDDRYFTEGTLHAFTVEVYESLKKNQSLFDEKMKYLFHHMTQHNWLFHYRTLEGLERTLIGMCKRFPILGQPHQAIQILHQEYNALQKLYTAYFPELILHVDGFTFTGPKNLIL
ncbi:MAG: DUF479 domain-containing protein [Bacteroidetes bacterium]|nr:DUF479 domain-containing protein [Bacteroidota bacterium]